VWVICKGLRYLPGRALADVSDDDVDLGEAVVVVVHYHLRTAYRHALRLHLRERPLAYPTCVVVPARQHHDEEGVGYGCDDLGYGRRVHAPFVPQRGSGYTLVI